MQGCRNCGSTELKELGFVGEVAPFFLKRVLNAEIALSRSQHPLRLLARRLCALPQRFFSKVYGDSVYVEMQACLNCSFIQTKHAFSDDALGCLYADYRAESYNQERIRYEPSYAALAKHVGVSDREVKARMDSLTAWLTDKVERDQGFSMLDYGGSDGRFLPAFDGAKYVFEISNTSPAPGVGRISEENELRSYSYVQIAHVLEHVPEPLALIKRASSFVKRSGYLYIEVPQDLSDSEIAALQNGHRHRGVVVHEHINMFCTRSITRLVQAAGLELLSAEQAKLDLGWIVAKNIRALCRKL